MSFLIRKLQPRKILNVYGVLRASQARCHWAPDFIPGPYPKTKEEREAAAAKYNLLPEEYEPYPDDGWGFGDYPLLPLENVASKDPYYPWDDEELRRDFMEPVHHRVMNTLPEQDPMEMPWPDMFKELLNFTLIPIAICTFVMYLLYQVHFHHALEKQYPQPGVKHYTFELDYEELERRRRLAAQKIC